MHLSPVTHLLICPQTLWTSSEAETTGDGPAPTDHKDTNDAPPAAEPEKASE